jgi:hypothetical protein
MLCNNAIRAYKEYGTYNDSQQRGFLVNYDSLPGSIPRVLLPSFGVEPSDYWLSKMAVESKSYSKGRNVPKLFFGDSEDKEERATAAIQQFSNSILQSSYEEMAAISTAALKSLSSTLFEKIVIKSASGATLDINWKSLKDIPVAATYSVPLSSRHRKVDPLIAEGMKRSLDGTDSLRGRHSSSFKAKEYLSWAPFSNTHNSKPVQVILLHFTSHLHLMLCFTPRAHWPHTHNRSSLESVNFSSSFPSSFVSLLVRTVILTRLF